MKKFVLNKNLHHNGKAYAKGSAIGEDDGNFKMFAAAGHLDGAEALPVGVSAPAIAAPVAEVIEEKPAAKPARKSK